MNNVGFDQVTHLNYMLLNYCNGNFLNCGIFSQIKHCIKEGDSIEEDAAM